MLHAFRSLFCIFFLSVLLLLLLPLFAVLLNCPFPDTRVLPPSRGRGNRATAWSFVASWGQIPTVRLLFWAETNCCDAIDRLRIVGLTFSSTYESTASINMIGKHLLQHRFFGEKKSTGLLRSPLFNTAKYVRLCLFHIHSSSISKWSSPFEFCGVKAHA